MSKVYGLKDDEGLWYGDDKGPHLYRDAKINGKLITAELYARLAATVISKQVGRLVLPCEYEDGPKQKKDEIDVKMNSLEALQRIEKGEI